MTGIRDELWITNRPGGQSGGETSEGAVTAGAIGAGISGIKDFVSGGPKSEDQQAREWSQKQAEEARSRSQQEEREGHAEICRQRHAKETRTARFGRQARLFESSGLPEAIRARAAEDRTLSQRVHRRIDEHWKAVKATTYLTDEERGRFADMERRLPVRLSDIKWMGPNGALSDHGIVDPAEIDFGYGGAYKFNQVWDDSLPYYRRHATSQYHRRIAETYVIGPEEAALAVIAEYANPGSDRGLSRFRAPPSIAREDRSRVRRSLSEGQAPYVQEYTILNMMHQELERLREDGPNGGEYKSPEDVLKKVSENIKEMQTRRMATITEAAYANTRGKVIQAARDVVRQAMIRTERGVEDFNFSHDEYLKISDGCGREDLSRLKACADSIRGTVGEVAEDFAVTGGATALARGGDPRSLGVLLVTSGHRVVRAARKSPACRDALQAYQERACMKRVLPKGVVKVEGWRGGSYVAPDGASQEPSGRDVPQASTSRPSADEVWTVAGRSLSRVISNEGTSFPAEPGWADWGTVGSQISRRIMSSTDADSSDALNLARYFGTCWAKAKEESSDLRCVQAFRDHAWSHTREAAAALVLSRPGKLNVGALQEAAIKVALKSLDDTMADSRCDLKDLERRVDGCVRDLYTATTQPNVEVRDD